jgi:hypothetical protein
MPWLKRRLTVFSGALGLRSMPRLKRPVNRFSGVSGSCSMPSLKRRVPVCCLVSEVISFLLRGDPDAPRQATGAPGSGEAGTPGRSARGMPVLGEAPFELAPQLSTCIPNP